MRDAIALIGLLADANVQAFLRVIRAGEGTADEDGYRRHFGGRLFDSFADHPRVAITAGLGSNQYTSTAAGAYQFLARTWDGLVRQYGFADFTPRTQDIAALALIDGRKALDDVIAGRFDAAVRKCNREWASLPGSPYGQPTRTMAQAHATYWQAGGALAPATEPITVAADGSAESTAPAQPPKEATMPTASDFRSSPLTKFALAAVNPLLAAAPEFIKLFLDKDTGQTVPERNATAAVKMLGVAQQALQEAGHDVPNAQAVAEAIESDPRAKEVARAAMLGAYFEIAESGGGGIEGARKADAAFAASGTPPIRSPAFLISLLLLVMPMMLLADVFYVHPGSYDTALRTQIVTAVLMVISLIGAFWLGSSFGSQKKDDRASGIQR